MGTGGPQTTTSDQDMSGHVSKTPGDVISASGIKLVASIIISRDGRQVAKVSEYTAASVFSLADQGNIQVGFVYVLKRSLMIG